MWFGMPPSPGINSGRMQRCAGTWQASLRPPLRGIDRWKGFDRVLYSGVSRALNLRQAREQLIRPSVPVGLTEREFPDGTRRAFVLAKTRANHEPVDARTQFKEGR